MHNFRQPLEPENHQRHNQRHIFEVRPLAKIPSCQGHSDGNAQRLRVYRIRERARRRRGLLQDHTYLYKSYIISG
jgi:hypothetical protein